MNKPDTKCVGAKYEVQAQLWELILLVVHHEKQVMYLELW